MAIKILLGILSCFVMMTMLGCGPYMSQIAFPSPDQVFVTTGDGNIQKPYTPVGQMIYGRTGFRLSFLPIFGLIPFDDVDPDVELRTGILNEVKKMGGDAVINLQINWVPAQNGILGLGATGGSIVIYGTVIKR